MCIRDSNLSHDSLLQEGGIVPEGELLLVDIPLVDYSEVDLQTSFIGQPDKKRYFVLAGPGITNKAYTTVRIFKKDLFKFDVHIRRVDSINSESIIIPQEE